MKAKKVKVVKVLLEPKNKMRDKKGRVWEGMNKDAAKPNKFRKIKTIEVRANLPKHLIKRTERHEEAELKEMDKGKKYKVAHKIALKKESKPIKGVHFIEHKATKTKRSK